MLKLVRNWSETCLPNRTTAMRARTSPNSQRTKARARCRRSSAKVRPPLPQRCGQPERDPAVEGDRAEEERPCDCFVTEGRHTENVERREDRVQEQRAKRCADHATAPAEDRNAP